MGTAQSVQGIPEARLEEELVLVDAPSQGSSPESAETPARALDALHWGTADRTMLVLATGDHPDPVGATAELGALQMTLARALAYREPQSMVRVELATPDPDAPRRLSDVRRALIVTLAGAEVRGLPRVGGEQPGQTRLVIFRAFARPDSTRRSAGCADRVHAADALLLPAALAGPTVLWWDLYLRPSLADTEVAVVEARPTGATGKPFMALVRSVVRAAVAKERME